MSDDQKCELIPNNAEYDEFLSRMRMMGVMMVEVSFAGGGDSGSIDGCVFVDDNGNHIDMSDQAMTFTLAKQQWNYQDSKWLITQETKEMTFPDIAEALCYEALERSQLDWYNNDGGQGTFFIDFNETPPKIWLDLQINIPSTEDHALEF